MAEEKKRRSERLMLSIPVRVRGGKPGSGEFTEDTRTSLVNRFGARVALRQRIAPNDTLHLINLENHREADFRAVAPVAGSGEEIQEWGIECLDPGRDIWGIEFGPPLSGQPGALIRCRGCRKEVFSPLTTAEAEALKTTGVVRRQCSNCNRLTDWEHSEITRRPRELPSAKVPAPPRPQVAVNPVDQRQDRRVGMKQPILVRGPRGQEEVSNTENVSAGGLALSLAMELNVGDGVRVLYPYSPGGRNPEQNAEIRRRANYALGGRRLYGVRLTP